MKMRNSQSLLIKQASDGKFTATCIVNITIKDVNNNAPVFERENYMVSIKEDTPIGTFIMEILRNKLN